MAWNGWCPDGNLAHPIEPCRCGSREVAFGQIGAPDNGRWAGTCSSCDHAGPERMTRYMASWAWNLAEQRWNERRVITGQGLRMAPYGSRELLRFWPDGRVFVLGREIEDLEGELGQALREMVTGEYLGKLQALQEERRALAETLRYIIEDESAEIMRWRAQAALDGERF